MDLPPTLQLLGFLLAVLTLLIGTVRYVMNRVEQLNDKAMSKIENLGEKTNIAIDSLDKQMHTEIGAVREAESKARHGLSNQVSSSLASMQLKMDSFAKREEMRETETRLTVSINKVGDKVDELTKVVATFTTVERSITGLSSQLDRMAMRLDNVMPTKSLPSGGD